MQVTVERLNSTEVKLVIELEAKDLAPVVTHVFSDFAKSVKIAGFRPGKAPNNLIEREVGDAKVQAEVIEHAASQFFQSTVAKEKLRVLVAPHVEIRKFVAYSQLELVYSFEVFPQIKLADYKKIKKTKPKIEVNEAEIDQVIASLRLRLAKRSEVSRASAEGDELMIDMVGTKDGVEVAGTRAKDYPVVLGLARFVPGFETELVGLKPGAQKDFKVTFPKDYPESSLQNQLVRFSVEVKQVNQLSWPAVDDQLAREAGPFKDLAGLKADIKKQIASEKDHDGRRALTDSLVDEISAKSKLDLPKGLVARQTEALWQEFEANVAKLGNSVNDYLKAEGKTRTEIETMLTQEAQKRARTALVLSEIARAEGLKVTPEELEIRLQILKGQHQDTKFRAELDKPANRQELVDQLLIEKTVNKLVGYATKQ